MKYNRQEIVAKLEVLKMFTTDLIGQTAPNSVECEKLYESLNSLDSALVAAKQTAEIPAVLNA